MVQQLEQRKRQVEASENSTVATFPTLNFSLLALNVPRASAPPSSEQANIPEEFMPLPERFVNAIERDDHFLVCFPRSGSRWLRLLLADLVNQRLGRHPEELYTYQLDFEKARSSKVKDCFKSSEVVPNAYNARRARPQPVSQLIRPLFKSHNLSQVRVRSSGPILYLFRSPLSCLYSHYHFLRAQKQESAEGVDLDTFFQRFLPLWVHHVSAALEAARENPERVLPLQYGKKIPFTKDQVSLAARTIGLEATEEELASALKRYGHFLARLNRKGEHSHPRSQNFDARRFLSKRTLLLAKNLTKKTFREAVGIANKVLKKKRPFWKR